MSVSVCRTETTRETAREAETAREIMSRTARGTGRGIVRGIDSLGGNRSGSGIWNMNMIGNANGSEEIGNAIGNMGVRVEV